MQLIARYFHLVFLFVFLDCEWPGDKIWQGMVVLSLHHKYTHLSTREQTHTQCHHNQPELELPHQCAHTIYSGPWGQYASLLSPLLALFWNSSIFKLSPCDFFVTSAVTDVCLANDMSIDVEVDGSINVPQNISAGMSMLPVNPES